MQLNIYIIIFTQDKFISSTEINAFYFLSSLIKKLKVWKKKKFFFHRALFRVKLIFKVRRVHAYSIKFGSLNIAVEVEK